MGCKIIGGAFVCSRKSFDPLSDYERYIASSSVETIRREIERNKNNKRKIDVCRAELEEREDGR